MAEPTPSLRILHFNDVYHVAADSTDPVGGAARFKTLLQGLQHKSEEAGPTLTLFSGDAYFPSLESSISRGEHMLPILNSLSIDASTFGNHEFDQGIDQLEHLIRRNNFPWVITNLTDRGTGGPAARNNSARYLIRQVGSLRIGVIGIVEKEWLDTLPCLPPTFEYHDFVESARDMATRLKQGNMEGEVNEEKGNGAACDLVICLSHMRLPNDIKLADSCSDVIDLVLSGHDHFYYIGSGVSEFSDPSLPMLPAKYSGHDDDARMVATWRKERAELSEESQGRRLVKSGTDFRDLSEISLTVSTANGSGVPAVSNISVTRHRVTRDIPEDPEVKQAVDTIETHLSKAMDKLVGFTTTALDARSTVCRTRESNIGSFTGDLMRLCYAASVGVEVGLLCGGAIRSDKVYPEGAVRMRDIMEIFPFEDPVVVVRLTGDQIRRALENGVSKWPAQEGRFPQVSGIRFVFDPTREPGDRVTSIVLTASAKAAASHAKDKKSPAGSNNSTTQLNPSRPRDKSISSMHRVAVENAIGASGDTVPLRSGRRNSTDDSGWDSESDADAASDYGGEEDELLDMDAEYLVATRDYMYRGHDGYEVLTEGVLVVDEENGITFSDLYRRYFYGLAVCNAWSFKRHGLAQSCSTIRHQLLDPSPGDTGGIKDHISAGTGSDSSNASQVAGGSAGESKHSRWKQLIVKHADNLRQLAQQQRRQQQEEEENASAIDESCQTLASRIASVVNQYHDSLATKAQLLTHRRSSVLRALLSSAKRLTDDQTPMRVARTALFGHEDNSATPMSGNRESETDAQGVPRNDDANGLLPGMPINRKDTRSYASEGLIAQWAVVSPQTDGRIENAA
ncbi:hypothetical protein IWW48_001136 [Coemansia sp. RSA 1200]|nr:hypothetical protein IWW48_001136 [Coemansia sp. RSA 1200]